MPFSELAAQSATQGFGFIGISEMSAGKCALLVVGGRETRGSARRSGGMVISTASTSTAALWEAGKHANIVEGIEALPEAFVLYDACDRLVYCNEAYRTLYPKVRDLMYEGMNFRDLVRESLVRGQFTLDGDIEDWYQRRVSFHDTGIGFFEQHLDDGRWIQVSERRTPSGAITSIRSDITVLKEREAELRAAKAEAEAAIAAKIRFMAVIGHELRNPLNAIYGMSQVLDGEALSPKQKKFVESIAAAARSIKDLLNELLDVARIEAGKLDVNLAPVDVRTLLAEVGALAETLGAPKRLRTRVDIASSVPSHILADGRRMRQVLTNLVMNACKFTSRGTIAIAARIAAASESRRVVISVKDTGPGIAKEDLPRLFEPFSRVGASGGIEGWGLGLLISKELCEAMGASLRVASTPGKGTRFQVEVPVVQGAVVDDRTSCNIRRTGRQLSVLVVDDDEVNLMVAKALLGRLGHVARTTASGEEAVQLAIAEDFDLMFLDIAMPDMSGIMVTQRIRDLTARRCFPIVAMTGNVLPHEVKAYMDAGIAGVVEKPIDLDQLAAAIRSAVRLDDPVMAINPEIRLRFGAQGAGAVVFDPSRLDTMSIDVGRKHVERILQEGLKLLNTSRHEVMQQRTQADRDRLLSMLHRLRADAGLFGLQALAIESGRMQRRLKLYHNPEPNELAVLDSAIGEALAALTTYACKVDEPARSSSR